MRRLLSLMISEGMTLHSNDDPSNATGWADVVFWETAAMPETLTPIEPPPSTGLKGLARRILSCLPARQAPVNRVAEQERAVQDSDLKTSRIMADAEALRLIALGAEDLAVISCNLQDAVVRVADVAYVPSQHRFALLASRFDWVVAEAGRMERCRAGLHFDTVTKVASTGFDRTNREAVLNLLSVSFEEGQAPSGTIELTFSGGAAIRLDVECVDAQMRDLGVRWTARHKPGHAIDDAPAEG